MEKNDVKYLYGAAVQGIQGFIFQTNKLREIVGASELVEEICTDIFVDLFTTLHIKLDDDCWILHAAGNIKYIFTNEEECKNLVREFPKRIAEFAPGITVSQAVVKCQDNDFENAVNELEKRLKTQRNKPMRSATLGLMSIERSRQTGLPVVLVKNETRYGKDEKIHLDAGTKAKLYEDINGEKRRSTLSLCNKAFLSVEERGECDTKDSTNTSNNERKLNKKDVPDSQIAYDIEKITGKNDWVAIIHADGNGLGQIVQKIGTDKDKFKKFSKNLDTATTEAAYNAFKDVQRKFELPEIKDGSKEIIPIRPIVLGGDDLTVICRADIALDFIKSFLDNFENSTKKYLGETIEKNGVFSKGEVKDRLTACAGIAYIKSSFPFYYGYELAEALCSAAKKDAKDSDAIKQGKELPQSCLMFHKVQDSFTENWEDIVKRELTPQDNISFCFGPYYLKDKPERWTIGQLTEKVRQLEGKEGNAVKSHLRNWLSLLHDNPGMANQKLARLKFITTQEYEKIVTEITFECDGNEHKTPVYDILAIHTINTQNTKNGKEVK